MFKAIEHVGIKVADLGKSLSFYTDILGFRLTERGVRADVGLDLAFLEAPGGGAQIELIHPWGFTGGLIEGVVNHFSLAVDDVDAALAHLRAKGVEISSGPLTVLGGHRIAFFSGPDGEKLELFQRKSFRGPSRW